MTGNSSVYVRNENQGEYTKKTHCEKKIHLEIECDTIMLGDKYLIRIFRKWDDLLFGIISYKLIIQ